MLCGPGSEPSGTLMPVPCDDPLSSLARAARTPLLRPPLPRPHPPALRTRFSPPLSWMAHVAVARDSLRRSSRCAGEQIPRDHDHRDEQRDHHGWTDLLTHAPPSHSRSPLLETAGSGLSRIVFNPDPMLTPSHNVSAGAGSMDPGVTSGERLVALPTLVRPEHKLR